MNKTDLRKLDAISLRKEVVSMKRELFNLRLSGASTHVKDNSQFRKLKVKIAQALTFLTEENK